MAKRLFQGVILFFAIYAFVFVPLGQKTGLEHVRAIAGTSAAKQAGTELKGGVERLVQRLRNQAQESTESADQGLSSDRASAERAKRQPVPKPLRSASSEPQRNGPTRLSSQEHSAPANVSDPRQLQIPSLEELDGVLPGASAPAAQRR